jgi:DNA-binding beta-propeller fold protein YncE
MLRRDRSREWEAKSREQEEERKNYALSSMPLASCFILYAFLLIVSCCVPTSQPKVVLPTQITSAPRLMGVNHLFALEEHFSRPAGIAVDVEGNLYVADSGKSAIHVLNKDGKLLESIGRFGWRSGEFDSPADVAIDSRLRLYIADSGNNRIQRFGLVSRNFSIIAGEKQDEYEASLVLSEPQSVAADLRGYVYIADTWEHRILKTDPLGRLQMEMGGLGWTGSQFKNPQGVAVDSKGNIYISDTGNNRVHKLDFSGAQIAVWGEEGSGVGQFRNPTGQTIDRFGNVYVVDRGNHRIQIFKPSGSYLTEFGQDVLTDPVDVAVDRSLRAYVTDSDSGNIEVFRIIYEMAENIR